MALADYDEAVARALVAYLQAAVDAYVPPNGTVQVVNGFSDGSEDQPTGPAFIAVSHGQADETPISPVIYRETADGDDLDVLDAVARWSLTVQVDLFTSYRDQRAELGPVIRQALSPGVAHPKLALTLEDYHDLVALLAVDSVQDPDDDEAYAAREWRRTWSCTVTGMVLTGRTLVSLDDNRSAVTAARDIDI